MEENEKHYIKAQVEIWSPESYERSLEISRCQKELTKFAIHITEKHDEPKDAKKSLFLARIMRSGKYLITTEIWCKFNGATSSV